MGRQNAKQKTRKRPRRRNPSVAIKLITTFALVAALLFCALVFFKVDVIEVEGSSHYTDEEIISASGLSAGDNLVMLNKAAAASQIKAWLPYVEQVQISRRLPDRAIITVTECDAVAAAVSETGQWWLLSGDGKLLEQVDAAGAQQYAVLTGVSLLNAVSGCAAETQDPDQAAAAVTILGAMEQWELTDVITTVDLTKLYDIELWYGERFEIKLGSTENLSYKIQYLQAVLENLNESQSGVIDLTFETETVARFLPW